LIEETSENIEAPAAKMSPVEIKEQTVEKQETIEIVTERKIEVNE
jgi:hypothetical protein